MPRYTQLIVLSEDRQQEVFARRFLERCGIERGRIYYRTCPRGKLAGEQYVRERYPFEVRGYRRKCHAMTIGLVVVTDADTRGVADRLNQLDDALENSGDERRKAHERIGLFVPKRNIETWLHYLHGKPVNEEDPYPRLAGREADCKPAVEALADRRHEPLPEHAPPSLKAACAELDRVL